MGFLNFYQMKRLLLDFVIKDKKDYEFDNSLLYK